LLHLLLDDASVCYLAPGVVETAIADVQLEGEALIEKAPLEAGEALLAVVTLRAIFVDLPWQGASLCEQETEILHAWR
jgi:hypothetical protein